jgi:hypothetical protein
MKKKKKIYIKRKQKFLHRNNKLTPAKLLGLAFIPNITEDQIKLQLNKLKKMIKENNS